VSSAAARGYSTSQKRLIDQLANFRVVQDRAPLQFHWLLRRVVELVLVGAAHDELGRRRRPNPGVLAGLAIPGLVLLPDKPARLVLEPIRATASGLCAVCPK